MWTTTLRTLFRILTLATLVLHAPPVLANGGSEDGHYGSQGH